MKTSLLLNLIVLCWLSFAAGCQAHRTNESDATTGGHEQGNGAAVESRQATSPQGLSGQSQRMPPGRGLGRVSGRSGLGRGRAQYRPIQLAPAEIHNLGIATAKAAYHSMRSLHSAMGKVLAPQSRMAKVSYAFPARISAVHVKIGDWVEKGQPVLTVQSEEVGRAKSEYYKAVADLELARQNYEREKRLFARGVGAQKNTLATEAGFKVAQASLEAAEKKLHVLGFSEAEVRSIAETHQIHPEITLFAPISGRVIEHNGVLGSTIDQTTDLMTIMDPTLLWVDAEIFERDVAKIRIGQNVQVTVPAYPGEVFRGKISYIGDTMNQETRTLNVRTEVQNTNHKLKHGMFADVSIILNGGYRVLTVPAEAILEDNNEDIVFVKTGGQYTPRIVRDSRGASGRRRGRHPERIHAQVEALRRNAEEGRRSLGRCSLCLRGEQDR
jgi:cobalt-zinc-cadmium efflux system membrane fusion protein